MQQPSEYAQNPQAQYGQQPPPSEYAQNPQAQYGQQPSPYMQQQPPSEYVQNPQAQYGQQQPPSEYVQNPQAQYGQQPSPYMQQQQPSEYAQNPQAQYRQQPPPYMQQPSEYPQDPQAYYRQQQPPSEYAQNPQAQYGQQPTPYMQQQQYAQPFQPQYPPQQQPYMPYPAQQQSYMSYPPQTPPLYQPQPQMNVTVNVNQRGPNFLIRVVWYLFIGWWLGGFWLAFGYFCFLTGIGIPLGLVVLNRLPRVLTLRPASQQTSVMVSNGNVTVNINGAQQVNFLVRVVYFLCLGWWLGGIWASIGYGLCLTILGLPLGLMMLNRLPAVLTLYKH